MVIMRTALVFGITGDVIDARFIENFVVGYRSRFRDSGFGFLLKKIQINVFIHTEISLNA